MLSSDFSSPVNAAIVLLASVLKPLDDTRMRGKFAETLLQRPDLHLHIAGRAAKSSAAAAPQPQLQQHAIFRGSRLSLGRLAAQWRYWQLLRTLRPALVVVHAPELLPLTLLWQHLGRGRQFIYDIQENFALNIRSQGVYPAVVRHVLAALLRQVETVAARRAAAVVLAEASYADELPYLPELPAGRVLLLENKYQPQPGEVLPRTARPLPTRTEPLRLLFSGTIAELTGVREAIELARHLGAAWPGGARLTVIGFCQQPALLAELQQLAAAEASWLTLIGGAALVPHAQIVAAMEHSHLGLLPYRPHPSTEHCRPTKLFEYLAHGLPVLVPPNPLWAALVHAHQAGLVVDFAQPATAAVQVVAALPTAAFYPAGPPTDEVLWVGEGKKLRHLLDCLLPPATFVPA
ncbi:glycosyltransferase family 4 protein [Hymenobacter setariae]|uniref:Glycosyltransferase family 4 protein n=1 Tax=Hymenobacter setariae TaxID=2594794 RepID=A0A558C266_9BACT|nr:glycosyltransferase family 4 protein [Hymenobacter setariae]TVT42910.1 glycosyltransferase family 4 protein [Hymenobacter setariae]